MDETQIIILFSVSVIFLVEIYSETQLKNYGTFIERSLFLFSLKNLFVIIKFSVFISFIYILFGQKYFNIDENIIRTAIFSIDYPLIYLYFLPTICFSLFVILSNSQGLFRQLKVNQFVNWERLNQLTANIQYVIFRLISFCLTFLIFISFFKLVIDLHEYFIQHKLSLFDWLATSYQDTDNYNKGVYFSLVVTIIIFFLFNNAFIKKNSGEFWNYRTTRIIFFKYFFISMILSVGLFFGVFSILNGIYNLMNIGASSWINEENILGILPIRISSILITLYLLKYIFNEVLHKKPWHFLMLAVLPVRSINNYNENLNFQKTETLFFAQISFYILNIALAELFIILSYSDAYLGILNFAILFIIDDFKIINDYSNGLRRVLRSHFIRIWLVNLILIIASTIILVSNGYYIVLSIYILFTLILFRYYFINLSSIYIKKKAYHTIL